MNSGYRLINLEIFNWGTFDSTIWPMTLDGHSCLLTGENGTGKSTLIDAFLSLLVPNKRRSYNMSSGSARRERNETTYVRGAFQREKTRWDQIQVKYLRDTQSLSALSAHFENPLTKDKITLAQFFWFESGELRKCLVISHDTFSLKTVLTDVNTPADLRCNLKQLSHTTIFPSFREYQDYFIRYMGLRSYKGMDLFNQVSTIKQIGNLNDFVRQNMLEETDIEALLHEFFHTFEDLTLAHRAIIHAREQIDSLDGLDKEARKLSDIAIKFEQTAQLQTYLPRYFAAKQYEHLIQQQQELSQSHVSQHAKAQTIEQAIDLVREQLSALTQGLDGKTREDRLARIQRELDDAKAMYEHCKVEQKKLETVRRTLGLTKPLTLENFTEEQLNLPNMINTIESNKTAISPKLFSLRQIESELKKQLNTLSEDLLTTQKNKTLIPQHYLNLRQMLCEKLNLSPRELPYAAELMTIKEDESIWRPAVEKLLRPLALKLLVPTEHFIEANRILKSQNIGMRIVLQRIELNTHKATRTLRAAEDLLITKLVFLPHAPQVDWLKMHIEEHFSYTCVHNLNAFQDAPRAITQEGLIKRNHHLSEKDDRATSHAQYILGWAHEDKIKRLTEESKALQSQLHEVQQTLQQLEAEATKQDQALLLLAQRQLFDTFDNINTTLWENKIKSLNTQYASFSKQPEMKEIDLLQQELKQLAKTRDDVLATCAVLQNDLKKIPAKIEQLNTLLQTCAPDETLDASLKILIDKQQKTEAKPISTSHLQGQLAETLRINLAKLSETKHQLGLSLVRRMTLFKSKFPDVSIDMEASLDDLPAFLQRYQTLKQEDLPTHEARFKKLISKRVITDLTAFKSTLELNAESIKENIDHLNAALKEISYTDNSYVQIRMTKTKHTEIREFQAILRNAIQTKGDSTKTLDLEESFQRIRNLIERLKSDTKWREQVTDVRNWTDFFMVELAKHTHEEISFYSDSSGLSGGQKAKLAFTILASALAYQYGLNHESALEKSFRFVMIDEAFSKSDDRNAQYALKLFQQLGLQLLVVTPLDKLDIIKPFVERIFVTQVPRNEYRSKLALIKTTTPSVAAACDG